MANALRATEQGLRKKIKPQAEFQSSSMISMDDGQPARDKPHVNAVLQTAVATGLLAPPLLTRWILDLGSNCHVTNTKGADWILTKRGRPSDCVYAGGALTQVEEWGETTIQVKTPTGEGQMKLTWVAYIPGFFTSVVGLSRSRSLGINFDSGRDCLYQKKASNIICLLQYRDGHWLVDVEKDQKVELDLLSTWLDMTPRTYTEYGCQHWDESLGRVLRTRDVVFMSNNGTEPVYPDRQTLREVLTILDVPEQLEETDQEIELLLKSAQRDWSGPSRSEQAARTDHAKDTSRTFPTPESTPESMPEPEPELETVEMPRGREQIPVEAEAPDRRLNNAPRREEISG
ncbi:hypothetical protein A1F95_10962 [Pyrenophora tritici-repentis]|nr:hypothetical protein A1F95_10962 [Pyrenophora tritici-repentis]